MNNWAILRWDCEGETACVCVVESGIESPTSAACVRLSVGLNSVTLSGLSVEQLQGLEDGIRKARVRLAKAEGQARRAATLKDCPPVGSIVEHVAGGRRGRIVGFGASATKVVELQGEWCHRNWQPDTYVLIAAADATGVVNVEQA